MSYVLGLTGGIGSGKTAASDWFYSQGINVIDADIIARKIVAKGSGTLSEIAKSFGQWVIAHDGTLNRPALRKFIFNNAQAKQTLESITHPAIQKTIKQELALVTSPYCVLVVPLLFEGGKNGLQILCNRTLVVDVPINVQLERASSRDAQSREQIKKIIASQISREDRLALADDVVDNSADLNHLYSQLQELHPIYLQMAHPC